MKKNIIKFLDGKYSLIHSYWIIGTLGSIIVGLPIFITSEVGVSNISETVAGLILLYMFFYTIFIVISLIGIWRSAGFYILEKGKKRQSATWAYAARVMVVLAGLSLIAEILKLFI
jgi:hypothetical protein